MGNYEEAKAKMAASKERRRKRRAKSKVLFGAVNRKGVRKQLWDDVSKIVRARDAKRNGGRCLIGAACRGSGQIEVAYHIVPQVRGDSTRYDLENIVGSCCRCNQGENWHGSLYRAHHLRIFGREWVERLEARANIAVDLSTAELAEMRDKARKMLEAGDYTSCLYPERLAYLFVKGEEAAPIRALYEVENDN